MLIGMRADGAAGGDDADALGVRVGERGIHAGLDHAEDRHPVLLAQARQGVRGGRVAGHHDGLDPARNQKPRVLIGKLADGFRAFRAVGQAGRVAQIQNVLGGQQFLHRPHDGQAADTRVEKS